MVVEAGSTVGALQWERVCSVYCKRVIAAFVGLYVVNYHFSCIPEGIRTSES